jgi:hypothetical protein
MGDLENKLKFLKEKNLREITIYYITNALCKNEIENAVAVNLYAKYWAIVLGDKARQNLRKSGNFARCERREKELIPIAVEALIHVLNTHYLSSFDHNKIGEPSNRALCCIDKDQQCSEPPLSDIDSDTFFSEEEADCDIFKLVHHVEGLVVSLTELYFDLRSESIPHVASKLNSIFEKICFHYNQMNWYYPEGGIDAVCCSNYPEVCFALNNLPS